MGMMASPDPANYRYVDMNYVPIAAERLRQVVTAQSPSLEDAFLVVAKRIPVRIGLVMDQRKVHRLVTECGNASLMVEVRQVRIGRLGATSSTFGGDGMGGMPGMPGSGGFGFGSAAMPGAEAEVGAMPGGMPGGFGPGGADAGMPGSEVGNSGSGTDRDKSAYDLPVEIYGMVYIYNPVTMDKLAIDAATAGTAPAGEPSSTAPAPTTSPAPAATGTPGP